MGLLETFGNLEKLDLCIAPTEFLWISQLDSVEGTCILCYGWGLI
jgi:hypothetical protein